MAEMLVDGAKLDACNTAEADAIRAKTGGSSPIPYDYANNKGFADAIAAIPSGGSLPSVISKIDGGTFTCANDSNVMINPIIHNLGEKPKGYIVWSDYVMQNNTGFATDCLMFSYGIGLPWNNNGNMNTVGYSYYMSRRTTGGVSERNSSALTIDSAEIVLNVTANFHGGSTYKWLAWA